MRRDETVTTLQSVGKYNEYFTDMKSFFFSFVSSIIGIRSTDGDADDDDDYTELPQCQVCTEYTGLERGLVICTDVS